MDAREIEAKVGEMLAESKVAYVALYAGETKRDDWECDAWKVAFTKAGPDMIAGDSASFDFHTGLGNRSPQPKPTDGGPAPRPHTLMWEELEAKRKPVAPHAADVLACLLSDSGAVGVAFSEWCDEFGYESDSRKALDTYLACQETYLKLRRILGDLEPYRELLADY